MDKRAGENPPRLAIAESYLQQTVAPQAQQIDYDWECLGQALRGLGDRALLALRVPKDRGGAGWSEAEFRRFSVMVPRYCGALAFLQTQHQSAASMIASSSNEALKQQYLPRMGNGEVLIGVGFSQLRRRGEPPMKAVPVAGGYKLNGQVPWITGFSFFSEFIIGAALPDEQAVYGMMPLQTRQQTTGGEIRCSAPMQLAAMQSTRTVSAWVQDWFLPHEQVMALKPPGAIHESDRNNILNHGFYALGCAQAGLDILAAVADQKQLPFLKDAYTALEKEHAQCSRGMFSASVEQPFTERLQLRSWAIHLAGRCAQAAVIAASGAANSSHHPAQRVYREALVFSVAGQTTAVMEASLSRLL